MIRLLEALIGRPRVILTVTVVMALAGLYVILALPREASPIIERPVFTIAVAQDGVPAEDAERLLVKPVENALRGLEGLKELTAIASPGRASFIAEFSIRTGRGAAFAALRDRVARARSLLPPDAGAPEIEEADPGLPPVMTVVLSGYVPERTLQRYARALKDRIETVPDVLRADLSGNRPEVLDVIVDPARLQAYGISEAELIGALARTGGGAAFRRGDTGGGRLSVPVPGVFDDEKDVLSLPVRSPAQGTVTLGDIADVRRTFKEATGFTRLNGRPAILMQIVKRPGANIVETNGAVRAAVENATRGWPAALKTEVLFDQARPVFEILGSLAGHIVGAIALVMAITAAVLGLRSSLLVALSVAASVLIGFVFIGVAGVPLSPMVMFGLLLSTGFVADRAIAMAEYASREIERAVSPADAYRLAASNMAAPLLWSAVATLVVSVAMLFWPGDAGMVMGALPVTMISLLAASLFIVLVVLPVLSGLVFGEGRGRRLVRRPDNGQPLTAQAQLALTARGLDTRMARKTPPTARRIGGDVQQTLAPLPPPDADDSSGGIGRYIDLLHAAIRQPLRVFGATAGLCVAVMIAVRLFGAGAELFVDAEPEGAVVQIAGRGTLSAQDELELVKTVEARLAGIEGLSMLLTLTGSPADRGRIGQADLRSDMIGRIDIAFADFGTRPGGHAIIGLIRDRMAGIPGVQVEVRKRETGPQAGKPLLLDVSGNDRETAIAAAAAIRQRLDQDAQLRDVEDTRPLPSIDWVMQVNRAEASRYGADADTIGFVIQMITGGMPIGTLRPADSDEEMDIRARFLAEERGTGQFDQITVPTGAGMLPIGNFVERTPQYRTGERLRKNRRYVVTLAADTVQGVSGKAKRAELNAWLGAQTWPADIGFRFQGAAREEGEAFRFLAQAMLAALFGIFVMLVARFDSFYQTAVALLTVPLSVIGVLIGMLLTGQTFSIVMTGTAILALAGFTVGNAIILVDGFNFYRNAGVEPITAVIRTCAERIRPAMLATASMLAVLLPLAVQIGVNAVTLSFEYGSISSGWWVQFATSLIFGLIFAGLLTLILLPTLLVAPTVLEERWRQLKERTIGRYAREIEATERERSRKLLNRPDPAD